MQSSKRNKKQLSTHDASSRQQHAHPSPDYVQSLMDALDDIAVLSINAQGELSFINAMAQKILLALDNTFDGQALPAALSAQIKEAMHSQQFSFVMQYAIAQTFNLLKAQIVRLTHPESQQEEIIVYMLDCSYQVELENRLRQSERLLQTVIDTSPDYICIKDGNSRWVKANRKLLNLFQIHGDSYLHRTNQEIANALHPVFKSSFQYADISDEGAWNNHKPYHNEEVISLPQGQDKTLEVTKIASFQQGQIRDSLVMFARDVSEYKFIEHQLQNRSAILDTLISCDWLLHSSDSWRTVAKTVLQQACLAFRFTRATILKKVDQPQSQQFLCKALYSWSIPGFADSSHQFEKIDFNDPNLERWRSVLANGNPVYSEITDLPAKEYALLKQHDTVSIVIVPLFLNNAWWGNIVVERCFDADKTSSQELGSLMAIGRTLSVAIQRDEADTSLNLAKIAFDSASEGIMIIDTDGNIVGVNRGYTEITGYSRDEVIGTTPLVFQTGNHEFWQHLSNEGKWSGEITNHRKNGQQYNEWLNITVVKDAHRKITHYVGVFADITEIKQSQNKLYQLVNHDPLTGLPNRRLINELFEHAIKRAQRENHQIAVLFIDLDRFKAINDSLGHAIGDKLLLEASKRIQHVIRQSDVVGRLGGDEFLVIMDNIRDPEDASIKANALLGTLQTEFLIENKELFISASIGISIYPNDGQDVDGLIKAADIAMYQVKNNGKNNYCFYSSELSTEVVERFNLENQLRRALERDQFEVYFQPQMSLVSGEIIGAEALIRWHHPEYGMVSPDRFIPLAEETGIILPLGEWVLTQAALFAKTWVKSGSTLQKIAVNVSGIQIIQSNFADTVYGVLLQTDCDPSALELEITESTIMQNTEHVISTFNRIKDMGVSLAIDDFGTGYSSLSNLKRLPLDKLKIDRSFVNDLPDDEDDAAIASAIYAMATNLGFSVVAEGVETKEQEVFLKAMGVQEAQGYLYGKPVQADAFSEIINKHR